MKLKNHSSISSTNQIALNELVYVLFNGIICLGKIKQINKNDTVRISICFNDNVMNVLVNKNSIYLEKPFKPVLIKNEPSYC